MAKENSNGNEILVSIEDEMKSSYMDYSMSVIVSRALPDVRDGLKPVHRRILYAMNDMGLVHSKPYKKSARVVGEVLGKYHPHGDSAVYDTMVRMAQDFSERYPSIDGQGNFGSIDGDSAAAMRYTECRLSSIAEEMLQDLDKDTVKFIDNFDGSLQEPSVLPAKLPNLLVNGSSGIAVGMATKIPPHNLEEVVDAICAIIDQPDISLEEIMEIIKGPDFPTAGIIYGTAGVRSAYALGRGRVKVRAKIDIESRKRGKRLIVTEIPYQVSKSSILENIAQLIKDRKIDGITDLRDESDRKGMRIVIELRNDVIEEVVINQLYAHTALESTFGIINLALVDGKPKCLTLREMLDAYIGHRQEIVTNRTQYLLKKAEARAHILEGLIIALNNIDDVIAVIRKSSNAQEAKETLKSKFILTEEQAKAILDMRLQKLTGLERQSIMDEHQSIVEQIKGYKFILDTPEEILRIIKEEITEIKEKYGDPRRTAIETNVEEFDVEDLIPDDEVVVLITQSGYVKRLDINEYREQRRGGVGLKGIDTKEGDVVTNLFVTTNHAYILFFSNKGRVYWLKTYKVPKTSRQARGKAIINLLPRLEKDEKIINALPLKDFEQEKFLVFATKEGKVKKTELVAYSHPRVTGIIAINLRESDQLIEVKICDNTQEIILATRNGQAVRFNVRDIRSMGRNTMGVIGARLRKGDKVVAMAIAEENKNLLTITENGYGKRTPVEMYRKTKRGAIGVITIKTTERNGAVVNTMTVEDGDSIVVSTKLGMMIRTCIDTISLQSRNTMGVRIMKLKPEDEVMDVARVLEHDDEEEQVCGDGGSEGPGEDDAQEGGSGSEVLENPSEEIEEDVELEEGENE